MKHRNFSLFSASSSSSHTTWMIFFPPHKTQPISPQLLTFVLVWLRPILKISVFIVFSLSILVGFFSDGNISVSFGETWSDFNTNRNFKYGWNHTFSRCVFFSTLVWKGKFIDFFFVTFSLTFISCFSLFSSWNFSEFSMQITKFFRIQIMESKYLIKSWNLFFFGCWWFYLFERSSPTT